MKNVTGLLLFMLLFSACKQLNRIDLSGSWTVRLDSTDIGITESWYGNLYETSISLPGTTDMAELGEKCMLKPALTKPQMLHLTRAYSYIGPAWYSKEVEIPSDWLDKELFLHLERVLWDSQVWIDDVKVEGHEESLTTPHRYNLTPYIKSAGKHILTVRIDNRKRYDISVKELAHAYTEDTQVKWNGILGDMYIEALDKVYINDVQLYPDVSTHTVRAVVSVCNATGKACNVDLKLSVIGKSDGKIRGELKKDIALSTGNVELELTCPLDENTPLWNEFNPYVCEMDLDLEGDGFIAQKNETFGLRSVERKGNVFLINGKPLFLRGTLECCIFPLTGTPPTDEEGWKKVFVAAREYGMNHLRFHSWCPPEAAFHVADEMGFYLQVELPVWTQTLGNDSVTVPFLRQEGARISKMYGNHPSFCFWSMGNELQYDFAALSSLMQEIKKNDSRHLYTTTTFTFEKGHGTWPEPGDDYFVTQWTKQGWMRGQGVFNRYSPSFNKDFESAVRGMQVPAVTHEVGQYLVYPDMSEIEKYTGTLLPLNFLAVKNDLEAKGRLDKAQQYLQASGELAAILYKEEIERALKTPGISGFQLLDLHDFPGQGTALVGLLNAFWESKGIITGKEFREFCSPVVPLIRFPKAVYTNDETFVADVELSNYGPTTLSEQVLTWTVMNAGEKIGEGEIAAAQLAIGHNGGLGRIECSLEKVTKAAKLEICVALNGTEYRNRWSIWAYPKNITPEWGKVKYTRNYTEAMTLLEQGETVLFNPDWRTTQGVEGKFVPVFWSPIHFPAQAGTMGVLCNPAHPALSDFPTDMHSDWQWWDLNINSTALVADSLSGGNSVVDMVDNYMLNRRLTLLYEAQVGKGKLMLAMFDLEKSLENRPVARQMLVSVLRYMNSEQFKPSNTLGFEKMKDVFGTAKNKKQAAEGIY